MKNILTRIQVLIFLSFTIIFFSNCGGDEEPETTRVQKLLTSGTWTMQNVTVGGVNENDLFTGFWIQFSATGFSATNGEPVWPASGVWTFVGTDAKTFTRDDDVVVSIDELTESSMTLSLTWNETTLGSGRVKSVAGSHVFTFSK